MSNTQCGSAHFSRSCTQPARYRSLLLQLHTYSAPPVLLNLLLQDLFKHQCLPAVSVQVAKAMTDYLGPEASVKVGWVNSVAAVSKLPYEELVLKTHVCVAFKHQCSS